MLIELIVALFLGLLAGTFTGIFPGIHINLVAAFLASSAFLLQKISPLPLVIFIVSMSVTHTFLDCITSIFLGAPEEDSFLAILPGHELLRQGKGHEAVLLTLFGSLSALPIVLVFIPIFLYFLPSIEESVRSFIPYVLIFTSLYLVFREKQIISSLIIFISAGFLGYFTLNLPVKEPLLPLLTGLFGLSALMLSIKDKVSLPKQEIIKIKELNFGKMRSFKAILAAIISAPLMSFLPGLGSSQAATLGSEIIEQDKKGFLFLIGSINTVVVSLSFIAIYSIGKARSGVAAAIGEILKSPSPTELTIMIFSIFISGTIAFFIGLVISKTIAKNISKISYKNLSIVIIVLLIILNFFLSNWIGLIVLIASTALGIFCVQSNVKRINLMGALLIPTIIYYLV